MRRLYPLLVGVFPGLIQTSLFFQLAATLSSSFGTYLLITLSWLVGSAAGVYGVSRLRLPLRAFLLLALLAYAGCVLLLLALPFRSDLRWVYAALVLLAGLYPGVFFARMAQRQTARSLFLWENNGFILGMVLATLLLLFLGRRMLWAAPAVVALLIALLPES